MKRYSVAEARACLAAILDQAGAMPLRYPQTPTRIAGDKVAPRLIRPFARAH